MVGVVVCDDHGIVRSGRMTGVGWQLACAEELEYAAD